MQRRKKRDPKVGTGKKPKGSGRRLYTDENPKDTVSIKFATPTDARKTITKVPKTKKGVPKKYVSGAKNPTAREKEILRTRKLYRQGKLTKAMMDAISKRRSKG